MSQKDILFVHVEPGMKSLIPAIGFSIPVVGGL
jgi:hypothetical protein